LSIPIRDNQDGRATFRNATVLEPISRDCYRALEFMQRHFPRPLILCLLVALALRLAFIFIGFPQLQSRWNLREDGDNYGVIAQSIRDGNYTDITRGPVYPVFLAIAGKPVVAKILQALLDTATCALIFLLARGNWWAALLWAVYPFAIWRVAFINKETILTFLLTAYVLAQWSALEKGKLWRWLLAGALLGVLNLCKPIFLFFPVVVAGILGFRWWRAFRKGDIRVATNRGGDVAPTGLFVAFLAAMVVVVAPWTVRNYHITGGEFLPVAIEQGGVTTFIGNYQPSRGLWEGEGKPLWQAAVEKIRADNPDATAVQLDRIYYRAAWEQITSNPLVALELFAHKCGRFWFVSAARRELVASMLIQSLYLGLAAFGLWKLRNSQHGQALLLAVVAYVMLAHAVSYADVRFSVIIMPLVCVLGGVAAGFTPADVAAGFKPAEKRRTRP
jgi:hypothetical protein